MNPKKTTKTNEITLANAMKSMFKNMKSGETIYMAFSRRNFYALIFVMGMSVIANAALVSLLVSAPTIVQRVDTLISATQLLLSLLAIFAGFWLFLKGIFIVTEK
jgi:hypothetical protein